MRVHQSDVVRVLILIVFTSVYLVMGFSQTPAPDLLSHLQGTWQMKGTVMKKPVKYNAEGVWILHHQFLLLHMKDVAVPSSYEVNLYIGIDTSKNQYVAHWLDSFGGAGARVVAFGPLSAEKIEIVYPYPEGRFRNLFKYNSRKDEWTLLIESEGKDGLWSVFAEYNILRKR
jgi:hypothetical protein